MSKVYNILINNFENTLGSFSCQQVELQSYFYCPLPQDNLWCTLVRRVLHAVTFSRKCWRICNVFRIWLYRIYFTVVLKFKEKYFVTFFRWRFVIVFVFWSFQVFHDFLRLKIPNLFLWDIRFWNRLWKTILKYKRNALFFSIRKEVL